MLKAKTKEEVMQYFKDNFIQCTGFNVVLQEVDNIIYDHENMLRVLKKCKNATDVMVPMTPGEILELHREIVLTIKRLWWQPEEETDDKSKTNSHKR